MLVVRAQGLALVVVEARIVNAGVALGAEVDLAVGVEDAAVTLGAGIVLGVRVTGACRWREADGVERVARAHRRLQMYLPPPWYVVMPPG